MPTTEAAVEAVWRIESGRLVGALTRITSDFAAAEDLAQDALEAALRQYREEHEELKRLIREGIDSGPSLSEEEVFPKLLARAEEIARGAQATR